MTVNGYGRGLMYLAATAIIGRQDTEQLRIDDESVAAMFSLPQELLQSAGWTGGGNEARRWNRSRPSSRRCSMERSLNDDLIEQMTTPVLDANYGLGISVDDLDGVTVYSHGGGSSRLSKSGGIPSRSRHQLCSFVKPHPTARRRRCW